MGNIYDDTFEQKQLLRELADKIKQKQRLIKMMHKDEKDGLYGQVKDYRINNIEFRESVTGRYEIVKWYPNTTYYNKLDEYLKDGYCLSACGGWVKSHLHSIDISFFSTLELCYTIATLEYNAEEESTELKSVGERLLKLSKKERKDFWKIYEKGSIFVKKKNKKNE